MVSISFLVSSIGIPTQSFSPQHLAIEAKLLKLCYAICIFVCFGHGDEIILILPIVLVLPFRVLAHSMQRSCILRMFLC